MSPYAIHWFRRDLKIAGNTALQQLYKKYNGRVLCVFCFDKKFLNREDFSVNRFQFFLKTLQDLQLELRARGSDLIVMDVGPKDAFSKLLKDLDYLPELISWNRDYEPFAITRDSQMKSFFEKKSISTKTFRDHLLIEPHELEKDSGGGYQVFTPFSRKWLQIFDSKEIKQRIELQKNGIKLLKEKKPKVIFDKQWVQNFYKNDDDILQRYIDSNSKKVTVSIPDVGCKAAYQKLILFKKKLERYSDSRDIPSLEGTSGLSPYLKNGSITISQIIYELGLTSYTKATTGKEKFFSELIWREFYYHILSRYPRVENEAFILKYKDLKWENNSKHFNAWKNGQTGFPIVDAGMRELKKTGNMHNRVRMIVASFLTKDLLIDWRWGEQYFMEQLLDGDLAANNGGWQWAASTGCDPQPYFRIFNPWLQSKRFDKDGIYIKKFIPELKEIEPKKLHSPITNDPNYPSPIVDHSVQREKALKMYKAVQ